MISKDKICSSCRRSFARSSDNFHQNRRSLDRLNHRCKSCAVQRSLDLKKNGTYNSYRAAMERCRNTKHKDYACYGGRGICFLIKSWKHLEAAIGPRPPLYTLDRINVDGHYEIGNVRWSSRQEQAQNTRRNTFNKILVRRFRELKAAGWRNVDIAVRFGKPENRVAEVLTGRTWSNVESY